MYYFPCHHYKEQSDSDSEDKESHDSSSDEQIDLKCLGKKMPKKKEECNARLDFLLKEADSTFPEECSSSSSNSSSTD